MTSVMQIVTHYHLTNLPIRNLDWSAVDDSTYDGEGCAIGRGATEQEAIADLLTQMEMGTAHVVLACIMLACRGPR